MHLDEYESYVCMQVVELLIRKLETEPSFHRKVDLFFLVDSITQCSHSQKGINFWDLSLSLSRSLQSVLNYFFKMRSSNRKVT